MLEPDFSEVGPQTVLVAIGQAFFSVGVAMGGMMTYGAYMPKDIHVMNSALIIVSADTLVITTDGGGGSCPSTSVRGPTRCMVRATRPPSPPSGRRVPATGPAVAVSFAMIPLLDRVHIGEGERDDS